MEFPSYVPHMVRELLASMIDGAASNSADSGWHGALECAERELHHLQGLQQTVHDASVQDGLRIACAKQRTHIDELREQVESLKRLAVRPEMQEVYVRLAGALGTDVKVKAFVRAAWEAHLDYAFFRNQLKGAAAITSQVAAAAGALHDILVKAEDFSTYLPDEFFSIKALLRTTDHDPDDRNFRMWKDMREVVLGDPQAPPPKSASVAPGPTKVELIPLSGATQLDAGEEARNALHYAWGTVPGLARLVANMQRAAMECVPNETGAIAAALSSQKTLRRNEYLRGFAAVLQEQYCINLVPAIRKAMAATATVVLDDGVVTDEEVSKALNQRTRRGTKVRAATRRN